ncbi:hypothetical protein [Streptomyces noursei]|uniref:hypothetical protein n=1 Tax=Streptomyces noursei TaxID=1971 RepID=UPI0030F3668C
MRDARSFWTGVAGGAAAAALAVGGVLGSATAQADVSQAPRVIAGPVSGGGGGSQAKCPAGTKVINGGWKANTFQHATGGTIYDAVVFSRPLEDGSGWEARELKGKVQAFAVCVNE